MASLNLLFVHEVSYEKKPIFEMHEFPEHLAARGHKVTFLQFDEGFKFWQGNRQPRTKTISGRVLPAATINLVTPHQFGIPGLDRLWATISVWPVLDRILKSEKFDAIVLYAVPTYGHQVTQLAKKYGVPVIFRALDVSHLIRKSLISPLIKAAEKYVYQHADVLSANNPAMARYCSTLGNRTKGTFTNLPPLDVSHFTPKPRDERLAASLGLAPTDLVITYMGSFFYFSGLDTVIREFAKIAATEPTLKLLLIGGGEQEAELKNLVKEHNLEGLVVFTGFIPYRELPRYLQLSTVAINPMLSRAVSNTAFPHKVLQYMAAKSPVVSTKLAGIFETFGANSGVTWVDGPAEVLAEAIALAGDGARRMASVQQQNAAVTRLLSVDRAIEDFEDLLDKALEVLK
jgi:glycosyltransferase involved in cell wall biosynthesis